MSKGAGRVSGLGDSDGLCVAAHSRATSAREKGPGCRPPSPLSSATRLRQSVGAGHARPAASPLPPRILCIVERGLDPSVGRRGRRPLQHNPQGFSLPQTSAAAWGQAALHPTLPYSVGRAFARNSFTPPCRGRACPARSLAITTPFILCIVGRGLDRLTAHNERRQPAKLARSCGCLPCRGKHCSLPDFAPLNRGPTLTTPHLRGASGTPPPTTQSAGLLITANVRGGLGAGRPTSHFTTFRGAGLRPQLHSRHPVGAGHARPSTSPLPPLLSFAS